METTGTKLNTGQRYSQLSHNMSLSISAEIKVHDTVEINYHPVHNETITNNIIMIKKWITLRNQKGLLCNYKVLLKARVENQHSTMFVVPRKTSAKIFFPVLDCEYTHMYRHTYIYKDMTC